MEAQSGSNRETITGVLHVIQTRRRMENPVADAIALLLEEIGARQPDYHPPVYFLLTDRTVTVVGSKWHFQFRFRGRPLEFSPDLRSHLVTVRATVEPFLNGLGAYPNRPAVIYVGDCIQCPYHEDSYDNPDKRSDRVFCRPREPYLQTVDEATDQ